MLAGQRCWPLACKCCQEHTLNTAPPRTLPLLLPAGKAAPPLPVTSSCQVWVNHKLRVLYVRHAKTGSSSLLCHFSGCRGEGAADTSFVPLEVSRAVCVPGARLQR